jgi:hypothetical protein
MTPPKKNFEFIKRCAEKRFLGRGHVIGVGIAGKKVNRLVFLLESSSEQSQIQIERWARTTGIPFEILVVGKTDPALT